MITGGLPEKRKSKSVNENQETRRKINNKSLWTANEDTINKTVQKGKLSYGIGSHSLAILSRTSYCFLRKY